MSKSTKLIRGYQVSFTGGARVQLPEHYRGGAAGEGVLKAYAVAALGAPGCDAVVDLGVVARHKSYRTDHWLYRTPEGGYGFSATREAAARQLCTHLTRKRIAAEAWAPPAAEPERTEDSLL